MKKYSIIFSFLFLISLLYSQDKLKVYYFPRPPLYTVNNNEVSGIITDIVKNVLNDAKIQFEFIEAPSKRVEESLKSGDFACGIGWFKRPEREEFAIFSEPIYRDLKQHIIINISKTNLISANPSIEEVLKSKLVFGAIDGFSYGAWADENIKKFGPKTEKATVDQLQLMKMIAGNRCDYTFIGKEEGDWIINSNPDLAKNLKLISLSDAPEGNLRFIMFSKGVKKEVIDKVNNSIKKLVKIK